MKLHKIILTICTVFILVSICYTVYNLLTPIANSNLPGNEQNSYNNYSKNTTTKHTNKHTNLKKEELIDPFIVSDEDIKMKDTKDYNNKPSESFIKYEVKKGDTLFNIARHHMSHCDIKEAVKTLQSINKINTSSQLSYGEKILIPTYNSKSKEIHNNSTYNNHKSLTYLIKPGDTLYKIAKHYITWCSPVSGINQIVELNNLQNSDMIKEGQKILIPCSTNQ
ncbi:LysM peptidoglycan-binding domain-containing protein [Haloimpatiens sp. FM7330]|uniref:LysM peptidoglycan-binding domain-containing protein n=1 Tax=Haloimpatiens sp. FM7330 TaxID=3298610 RepID=UPI0036361C1B